MLRKSLLSGLLLLVLTVSGHGAPPKSPDPSVQNLRAFAKLYGYVRWFHPSDEAASVDWERFAVHGARRVADAATSRELRQGLEALFAPIAPSVRIYAEGETPEPPGLAPRDTAGLDVVAWQHRGVGLRKGSQYRSIRLHRPPPLREVQGVVYQRLPADALRRGKLRFSAAARLAAGGGDSRVHLFLQVRGPDGRTFEDEMEDRPITSRQWRRHQIVGPVADDAESVILGAVLWQAGEARVDDARLEVFESGSWRDVEIANGDFGASDSTGAPAAWSVQRSGGADHAIRVVEDAGSDSVLSIALDRLPVAEPLFEERPELGEATDASLGRGLRARIPLALPGDEEGTLPRSSREELSALQRELGAMAPDSLELTDPSVRAADVLITWNVLQHFYPYFEHVEADWDLVLSETLTRTLGDSGPRDFRRTLGRMLHYLEDAHAVAYHPILGEDRGLPFRVAWIEEHAVVVASDDTATARVGDVVLALDGEPAWKWLAREAGRWSGSERWRRVRALTFYRGFGRGEEGTVARLHLLRNGRPLEVRRVRDALELPEERRPASFTELADGVLYVDLTRTRMAEIDGRIDELAAAQGVVVDVRGGPRDNAVRGLLGHLSADTLRSGHWNVPLMIYPDRREIVGWDKRGRWAIPPREPRFEGETVFLMNARAASFPEGILDIVRAYGLGDIVGQASAGVTGNVNPFALPGSVTVSWTGMKYLKPDSSRHHVVGVRPTVPVERSLDAVRGGRDEYLAEALEILRVETGSVSASSEEGGPR